jgi:hypothetical protein
MFPNPSQIMQPSAIPVSSIVRNSSLASAVNIPIPNQAQAVMIQTFGDGVYFRISMVESDATTDDFFISSSNIIPVLIPVPPGGNLSFIQNSASSEVVYQFVR